MSCATQARDALCAGLLSSLGAQVSKTFMVCEIETVSGTEHVSGVRSLVGLHPTESPCTPGERQELGGCSASQDRPRLGGDKGVKNPGKAANGFHRWPFSHNCKPSQVVRSGYVGPWTPLLPCSAAVRGAAGSRGPPSPSAPQDRAWGRGCDAASWPWIQQEAWKEKR